MPTVRLFRNLQNRSIGLISIKIKLEQLPDSLVKISMYILSEDMFETDIILGHKFLDSEKLRV